MARISLRVFQPGSQLGQGSVADVPGEQALATEKNLSGRGGQSDIQATQPAVVRYLASDR